MLTLLQHWSHACPPAQALALVLAPAQVLALVLAMALALALMVTFEHNCICMRPTPVVHTLRDVLGLDVSGVVSRLGTAEDVTDCLLPGASVTLKCDA